MATTIVVSDADRLEAETFLETILAEAVPEQSFAPGSFIRDIAITSIAHTVAFLRKEGTLARDRTSLRRVLLMAAGTDRDEAADDLLSNWFISRNTGRSSSGVIRVYVTAGAPDIFVPAQTKFYYDTTRTYVPVSTTGEVFSASTFLPVYDATGTVVSRYFLLNVTATTTGAAGDVTPAQWLRWDAFSLYVTGVENTTSFIGGAEVESTDALLVRARTAVSTRDLATARSITATLRDSFTSLTDVLVVGAGDPEMQRDLTPVGGYTSIHSGGCADVYLDAPVVSARQFTAVTGQLFTDPRPNLTAFVSSNWNLGSAQPGDILRFNPPIAGEAELHVITGVDAEYVTVSDRGPFNAEQSNVSFSTGTNYPNYDNRIPLTSGAGSVTRSLYLLHSILLPQEPIYKIHSVSYVNSGGTVVTLTRDSAAPTSGSGTYQLTYFDPQLANTGYQGAVMHLDPSTPDGVTVTVSYDTLGEFQAIHSFMVDPQRRVAGASILPRGLVPVYLTDVSIAFSRRATAVTDLVLADVATDLATYINAFPSSEVLNVSDMTAFLLTNYGATIASIPMFVVTYSLLSPDGQVVTYQSRTDTDPVKDTIEVRPSREVAIPALLPDPLRYGISSRTTKTVVDPADIHLSWL